MNPLCINWVCAQNHKSIEGSESPWYYRPPFWAVRGLSFFTLFWRHFLGQLWVCFSAAKRTGGIWVGCWVWPFFGIFWHRICFRERRPLGGHHLETWLFANCFREERRGRFSFVLGGGRGGTHWFYWFQRARIERRKKKGC